MLSIMVQGAFRGLRYETFTQMVDETEYSHEDFVFVVQSI